MAQIADTNETGGEIACKTPMIFGGYYNRPHLSTDAAMCDGYFRTGDLGKIDEDGYLYYLGRTKDIIITGGINVYPKDVESVLSEHPDISPSVRFSRCLTTSWVRLLLLPLSQREGIESTNGPNKFRHHCAKRIWLISNSQESILFLKELPKNGMGKIINQMPASRMSAALSSRRQK